MMLNQYENCMDKMRYDNTCRRTGDWYWIINGEESWFETRRPKREWD
jgi:hypothetical protein